VAFQPNRSRRQSRNALSALGQPRAQAVVYGVWATGILIGVVLYLVFVVGLGNGGNAAGKRNIQTALENTGAEFAPYAIDVNRGVIPQVEDWFRDAQSSDPATKAAGEQAIKGALARGQTNYQRICIGCHFGPPEATSNGPWLGNLYQTGFLYNGRPLNDANVVVFILYGSQAHNLKADGVSVRVNTQGEGGAKLPLAGGWNPMPAGIATPLQALDIMLYLRQQTCGVPLEQCRKGTQ
jgi:hypothetical protein